MSEQEEPRGSSWFRAVPCEGKDRNVEPVAAVLLEQEGHPPGCGWHELVGW